MNENVVKGGQTYTRQDDWKKGL